MRFRFSGDDKAFDKAYAATYRTIKKAAKQTIVEAAAEALTRGRADIAAAGFGREWQDGLQVAVYPKGQATSVNSAAYVSHKFGYAGVFEEGATIRGHPLLWVPLPGVPKMIGRQKTTAALYARVVGPMFRVKGPSGRMLLVRKDGKRLVPLFVGLDSVTIRKRFHIRDIVERVNRELPAMFEHEIESMI